MKRLPYRAIAAPISVRTFGFQEIMESAQQTRDSRLKLAEDDQERVAEKEYDDKLDGILAEMS
jgi:hypothetical protein